MKVLELFSGTHSVGNVCKEMGYEVVSLDLTNADINIDILQWDYKNAYKPGDFDIVWASPPCHTFSACRRCWINRKIGVIKNQLVFGLIKRSLMLKNVIDNALIGTVINTKQPCLIVVVI